VNAVELRREHELLADRGLRDGDSLSDPTLAHPGGTHGAQCEDTPEPRNVLVTSRGAVLRQQHKTCLSNRVHAATQGGLDEVVGDELLLEADLLAVGS